MELLDLILKLIDNYVPMNTVDKANLFDEFKVWRMELKLREPGGNKENEAKSKFEELYVKLHKSPWTRLAFAVMYIPIANWLTNLNSASYFDPKQGLPYEK